MTDDDSSGPVLVVEFTQQFTVHPPDEIEDKVTAEGFFWNRKNEILRDVLDPHQGEVEVDVVEGDGLDEM